MLYTPAAELRNAVESVTVDVRGLVASGLFVNSVTDVITSEANCRLTLRGGINLTGRKVKIDVITPGKGTSPYCGINTKKYFGGDKALKDSKILRAFFRIWSVIQQVNYVPIASILTITFL